MDSITQVALGATIAEAGFRRRLGGKAVALGAVCALLPDLDFALGFLDDWATMVHHRGFSHSLIVLPLVAPLMAWIGHRWSGRKAPFRAWLHLSLWALLTHPLLDLCTTYGTQLFWPVTRTRYALDAIAIIDPFYTFPLLLALIVARFRRLTPTVRSRVAAAALLITTAYLILGFVQSRKAIALAEADLAEATSAETTSAEREAVKPGSIDETFAVAEIRAMPTLANIWLWRVVARNDRGDLRIGHVSTWSPRHIRFSAVPRPDDPLVAAALVTDPGRTFSWFAGGMISAEIRPTRTGSAVILRDQRYGSVTRPAASLFTIAIYFDKDGRYTHARRGAHGPRMDWSEELSTAWSLIVGR